MLANNSTDILIALRQIGYSGRSRIFRKPHLDTTAPRFHLSSCSVRSARVRTRMDLSLKNLVVSKPKVIIRNRKNLLMNVYLLMKFINEFKLLFYIFDCFSFSLLFQKTSCIHVRVCNCFFLESGIFI